MQQKFIDLISNFNEVTVGTTKELMEANARAFKNYSQKQMEMMNGYTETIKRQLGSVSEIKDEKGVQDYLKAQTTEMQKSAETFYESAKESMEMIAENTKEVNVLMRKGMDAATATLKSVSGEKGS